jgi:hypothetical protein
VPAAFTSLLSVKTKRFLLGLVSMVLLATGFARAAELVDPVSVLTPVRTGLSGPAAPDCSAPCSSQCNIL